TEKIETILKKGPIDVETYWPIKLEIFLKMAVNLIANRETEKGLKYFREFCNLLKVLMVERININLVDIGSGKMFVGYQVEIKFNYIARYDPISNEARGFSNSGVQHFIDIIEPLSKFCQIRTEFINGSETELSKISEMLMKMKNYLGSMRDGKISVEDYIKLREDKIPDIEQFTKEYEFIKKADLPVDDFNPVDDVNAILVEVEKATLEEIIGVE